VSGFSVLSEIARENRRLVEEARDAIPSECPLDGEPLQENAAGVRNCPFGNYRWEPGGGGRALRGEGVETLVVP